MFSQHQFQLSQYNPIQVGGLPLHPFATHREFSQSRQCWIFSLWFATLFLSHIFGIGMQQCMQIQEWGMYIDTYEPMETTLSENCIKNEARLVCNSCMDMWLHNHLPTPMVMKLTRHSRMLHFKCFWHSDQVCPAAPRTSGNKTSGNINSANVARLKLSIGSVFPILPNGN
jgi:hypothetical protein